MVLTMHFNLFQRPPARGVIMHAEDGKSSGQSNKCNLLKRHRLEQSCARVVQATDFSAVNSNHRN